MWGQYQHVLKSRVWRYELDLTSPWEHGNEKEDSQRTVRRNAKLGRVLATTVAEKKQ